MSNFFAMLSRMKYIDRWGLMRNTRNENIAEHCLETAEIAHALAVIGNKRFGKRYEPERAALLAMYHDAPEIITGDLPTPVKYHSPQIREAYAEVEELAVERLVSMLPEDMKDEYRDILSLGAEEDAKYAGIIKAADKLSAVVKCLEEEKSGNTEFSKAKLSLISAVEKLDIPEARVFTEEFLPAYSLTLDELE